MTLDGPFDLVLDGEGAVRPGRRRASAADPPSAAWTERRDRLSGVVGSAIPAIDPRHVDEVADLLMNDHRARLVVRRDFSVFAELAGGPPGVSIALPSLLRRTVEALAGDRAAAASAVDVFTADALARVHVDPGVPEPTNEVALLALASGLLFQLRPETVDALAPVVVGTGGRSGLPIDVLRSALGGFRAGRRPLDPEERQSVAALAAAIPPRSTLDELKGELLGAVGAAAPEWQPMAFEWLDEADGLAEADRRARWILAAATPGEVGAIEARVRPWLQARAVRALRGGETLADARLAAVQALRALRGATVGG